MTDEELTDAWEAGAVLPVGLKHVDHVRIAWVLHRRHGRTQARQRLLDGTRRSCEVHGCPDKFDAALTERWAREIADAIDHDGFGASADDFLAKHAALQRKDLLGQPRPR